ncbi:MAG TPA: hypothetical protein VMT31_03810 [Methanomicrobiales archaeon]|jgi:hypothetical protein|nr:hypothetical protein [Methanomicrobiales archaeon]
MNGKLISGVILGAAFLVLFGISVLPGTIPWPATGPAITDLGIVKWEDRTLEVLYQGLILFSGVLAILLLLGKRGSKRASP